MDNTFEKKYAPWPVRIYVVQNGILTYIAQPGENMLALEELIRVLENL